MSRWKENEEIFQDDAHDENDDALVLHDAGKRNETWIWKKIGNA